MIVRRYTPFVLAGVLASMSGGCSSGSPAAERNTIDVEGWDTVFVAGSRTLDDTLFIRPNAIERWRGGLAISDIGRQAVVALDTLGKLRWISGGEGSGPSEFRQISDISSTPGGDLLVVDYGNNRLARLNSDGSFDGLLSLNNLPIPPGRVLALEDRLILVTNSPRHSIMEVKQVSKTRVELLRSYEFPWPEPLSYDHRLDVEFARHPEKPDLWSALFSYGPGMMVWQGDTITTHGYLESIPFTMKANMRLTRERADSARYAALAADAVGDEIFALFGGRPFRAAHPDEPTRWIDVYGFDGGYRRSYYLPFDADGMATDGTTLYLLRRSPFPQVVALQPRGGGLSVE